MGLWQRLGFGHSQPEIQLVPESRPAAALSADARALFWFDRKQITATSGEPSYERYAYSNLLRHFAPRYESHLKAPLLAGYSYFFYDGDCTPQSTVKISVPSDVPATMRPKIGAVGLDQLYIVAVSGSGGRDFAEVERFARNTNLKGYLGLTSTSLSFEAFESLMSQLGLSFALYLRDGEIRRAAFNVLDDPDLEKMGFSIGQPFTKPHSNVRSKASNKRVNTTFLRRETNSMLIFVGRARRYSL